MKNKLFISLLLAMFISCFSVIKAGAVSVSLNVLDGYIEVGEFFDVEVWVDGEGILEDLVAFSFDVDTSGVTFFSYTGYTIGSEFFDDSDPLNSDNVAGSFPFTIQDDYLLATLSFSTDSAGTDSLGVDGVYDGMFYGLFYFDYVNWIDIGFDISASTDITVNSATAPIPEPGTIFLLGSGLAGIVLYRRKRVI